MYPITHHHKTTSTSTNSELIEGVISGVFEANRPHLLTADCQSGGRGQHGRRWLSPLGNVYLSLYLPLSADYLHRLSGALSLCVGLSLCNLPIITQINRHRRASHLPPILVKWANDLGFYDWSSKNTASKPIDFNKLSGILIEPIYHDNKALGVVIGVGININTTPIITDGLYCATCLNDLSDQPIKSPSTLYPAISTALITAINWHNTMTHNKAVVLSDDFIAQFNSVHALHHKRIAIYSQNNATPYHSGICTGINPDGTLQVGNKAIFAGMAKLLGDEI